MEFWGYISHRTAFGQLSIKSPIGCSFVFYIDNAPLAATLSMKIFFFLLGIIRKNPDLKIVIFKKNKIFFQFFPIFVNLDGMSKLANMTWVSRGFTTNKNGFDTPRHCSLPWKNKMIGEFWA